MPSLLIKFLHIADEEVRQTDGFKNVHLGNVAGSKDPLDKRPRFTSDEDEKIQDDFLEPSFDVQVEE